MRHTDDAGYSSRVGRGCLRGTRADVLLQLEHWLKDEHDHRVFWLNGLAGTGKSTIAQTFAEISFADGMLGASFFCSRDFEDRSNLQAIFPTLAFQLAYRYLPFREQLLRVLRANPGVGRESLCSQMEKIILDPLYSTQIQTLVIVDALDECQDEEPASALLSVLSRYADKIPNVKFFITGRPEPRIRSGFRLKSLRPITEILRLHDVKRSLVDSDIKLFFRTQLAEISETRSNCNFTQDWPNPSDINILCKKSAGLFIYASTVVKFIAFKNHTPTEQLNRIISLPQNTTHEGRSGIDLLYTQVLEQAIDDMDTDAEEIYSHFRTTVGAVLLVLNPLSMTALSELLRMSNISATLHSLHSLLLVPENTEDPIRAFHKSFPDFLMDPARCKDGRFFVEPAVHHEEVLLSCFHLMGKRLKRNICNLDDYAVLSEVTDLSTHKKVHIGEALEYACRFWSKHLLIVPSSSSHIGEVQKAIKEFFTRHLLYWIEVLALTENLGVGVYAINDVEQWYALVSTVIDYFLRFVLMFPVQTGGSCMWINDSRRLLLEHFDLIHNSPSQLYHSALPFSPSSSWLHECYSPELLHVVKVVEGLSAEWGICFRTAFLKKMLMSLSCWNNSIAVGSLNGDICILDAITGSQTAVLSGHTNGVVSVTFSSDETSLVSGSYDKTVKLWDMQTGGVVKTFHGHTAEVISVAISADHTTIASGSNDKTLRLWDIQKGECHQIIEYHEMVYCVRFSPTDHQCLISASNCGTVQQWDTNGHKVGPTYNGHEVSFSPGGTQFVLYGRDGVMVHNINSRLVVAKFHINDSLDSCCFSPDHKLIAGVVNGRANHIYVWDITGSDPHLIETFVGHTGHVASLAFSSPSTLISASYDDTVKFWQIGASSTGPIVTNPKSTPLTLAPTKSTALKLKNGLIIPSDLPDGVIKTWGISASLHKGSLQILAEGSHQSNTRQFDNKLIFVWYADEKINIWNAEKGGLLQTINVPGGSVSVLKVSGDGSKVFCIYKESIQAWDIWTGEVMGNMRFQNVGIQYGDKVVVGEGVQVLGIDGSKVWVFYYVLGVGRWEGWDFGIPGPTPTQISSSNDPPDMLHLNDNMVWETKISRMKDIVTGKVVVQLPERSGKTTHVQWNGHYLVISFRSEEVVILDFSNLSLVDP